MTHPAKGRLYWGATLLRQRLLGWDPVTRTRINRNGHPVRGFGRGHGRFIAPAECLGRDAVVYVCGVGLDTTFEEDLMRETGCAIHAFDPTPRAIAHARKVQAAFPRFHFDPVGVWDRDQEAEFFAPDNPEHVSHSILGLNGVRPGFKARVRPVIDIMRELGHDRIDLLKMNIEGAEYAVLDSLHRVGPKPRGIVVVFDETHSPRDAAWRDRVGAEVLRLKQAGYLLVAVRPKGNYTFLARSS